MKLFGLITFSLLPVVVLFVNLRSATGAEPELIAGFVFYRKIDGNNEYLLLLKDGDWNFAKGHLEHGESALNAAKRETLEEIGIEFNNSEHYFIHEDFNIKMHYVNDEGIEKFVDLWPAWLKHPDHEIKLSGEHDDFVWTDFEGACELVKKKWKNEAIIPTEAYLATNPFLKK